MNTNKPQLEWEHFSETASCASYSTLYSLRVELWNDAWSWTASSAADSSEGILGTKPTKLEAMIAAEQYVARKLLELPKLEIRED